MTLPSMGGDPPHPPAPPGSGGTGAVPGELASACAVVRPADAADAAGGVVPRFVAEPASTPEAAAVLAAAAALGLAVVPRGTGSRIDWGAAPGRCDLIVDTRRMDAVLEHAAGDLVARVQAGVRLGDLAGVLAAAGQRLALDPPAAGPGEEAGADGAGRRGGTVGGLVATGVAGPLRLRFGAPRDLLIGVTMVRADGTVARAGGKVVKNVAGYDIGRLLAGSYGTLGLITEATFRLHPLPAATAYVELACSDAAVAAAALLAAAGSPLAPSAAELDWPGGGAPPRAGVLLEGDAGGVAERAERMRELLPGDPSGPEVTAIAPNWWGRGAAAEAGGTLLRIGFWAGQLAAVLRAVRAAAARAGVDPAMGGSAGAGVLHAALPADTPPAAVARFVTGLRAAIDDGLVGPPAAAGSRLGAPAGLGRDRAGAARDRGPATAAPLPAEPIAITGASAVVLHAPPAVRDAVDLWGPVPALSLMRAVKDQFDPEHRLAPGRFAGGI